MEQGSDRPAPGRGAMAEWVDRLKQRPWPAHLIRTFEHFNSRMGSQFGAAITYFSILGVIPVLMLAFSIAGFVLTISRPDLLDPLATAIADAFGSADPAIQNQILSFIQSALRTFTAIGIVGVFSALYSGAGWMANLRNAVRAQWREDFDLQDTPGNVVTRTLLNLVELLGVVIAVVLTFVLASLSATLTDNVLEWLGVGDVSWLAPILRLVPIVFSIGAGWLLFLYLYTVLPETRAPWKTVRQGALIGAVGLAILQYATSFLVARFSHSPAALIFGPVIALMLFFNLFARLILLVAAWIATARPETAADDAVMEIEEADEDVDELPPAGSSEDETPPGLIPEAVAARSVRVAIGTGYVTGAATGAGVGAALAVLLSALTRRKGRSHEE
jgi:membrane protein